MLLRVREKYLLDTFFTSTVAHVPLENGVSPEYGLEYVFTVNMNHTWTRESDNPFGVCILLQLHCSPKRSESEHVLSCSLKHNERVYFGRIEWDEDFYNWRKNITDEPIEVVFNRQGIEKIITSHEMKTYDLNVLRRVVESLHTGNDFEDTSNGGIFESTSESNIGTCNVVFAISRRPASAVKNRRDFKLYLQPPVLRMTHGESVVIEKTTNLNNCAYYAKNYYRKYGDTVVCKNRNADLVSDFNSNVEDNLSNTCCLRHPNDHLISEFNLISKFRSSTLLDLVVGQCNCPMFQRSTISL